MSEIKKGQKINVGYETREFEVIVIDPDGLGTDQASLGFGFEMMEKYGGLPTSTSDNWLQGLPNSEEECLKTPSGKTYRVSRIMGLDKNVYVVLEISDWVALAGDVLKKSGKVRPKTKEKLIDFLVWFSTKGLYAEAYTVLKGAYTSRDSRSLSKWMMARLDGKLKRNKYTDFLQQQGCQGYDYALWTNYIYENLFGKTAKEMKQLWSVVEGTKQIARNYVSEKDGLIAIAHAENLTVELFIDDLKESHDDAISNTKRKFRDVLIKLS